LQTTFHTSFDKMAKYSTRIHIWYTFFDTGTRLTQQPVLSNYNSELSVLGTAANLPEVNLWTNTCTAWSRGENYPSADQSCH
jgi:hypothetical protein